MTRTVAEALRNGTIKQSKGDWFGLYDETGKQLAGGTFHFICKIARKKGLLKPCSTKDILTFISSVKSAPVPLRSKEPSVTSIPSAFESMTKQADAV